MISNERAKRPAGFARKFALAIALATGAAMVGAVGFADTAQAQKRPKGGTKSNYSKEFVVAYQALEATMKSEAPDPATVASQSAAVASVAASVDERFAAGDMIMRAGVVTQDGSLQVQGVEMLLASGMLPAEQVGRYNFIAYQANTFLKQHDKARGYLKRALDENFATDTITPDMLQTEMMQSYFSVGQYREGIGYLIGLLERQREQGAKADEKLYRLGVGNAYTYEVLPELYQLTQMWISDYPGDFTWRESINITRNLNNFESPEILDLLRLARRVNVLENKQDYMLYIEAADARRLPLEVKEVIDQSYARNAGTQGDTWVSEQLKIATGRIATDRAEMASMEADASKPGAALRTINATANTLLSYGEYAKAAKFYEKALNMPGVQRDEVLNRMGMAQISMGDHSAGIATLREVKGLRQPLAELWISYAKQQQSGG
jgi:tetratricopeptide (TPR) repeat protein